MCCVGRWLKNGDYSNLLRANTWAEKDVLGPATVENEGCTHEIISNIVLHACMAWK